MTDRARRLVLMMSLSVACLSFPSHLVARADEPGAELPKKTLTRLISIWEKEKAGIVSGHAELLDFSYYDEKPTLPLEKLHRLLQLDGEPDFANLVPGRKLPELPAGISGPGGWGAKIELDFELEKIRNAVIEATGPAAVAAAVVTFDGKYQIEFEPLNEQVTIFAPTYHLTMRDLSNIRYSPPAGFDISEVKVYAESGRPGVIVKAPFIEIHADEVSGRIHRVVRKDRNGLVAEEVLQYGPWTKSAGFSFPRSQVRVTCEPRGVRTLDIYRIENCQFNVELPAGTFTAKTPQSVRRDQTVIVDNRNGSRVVRSHAGPIGDVMAFADKLPNNGSGVQPPATTFWRINAAIAGVLLLVSGIALYSRSKGRSARVA